jgi:SOS-response transcriptional repressor LexA
MSDAADVIADLLSRGHAVQFQARGDSMHPLIRDNDSLHVEPVGQVRRGDVVLVLAHRGLTAHRVLEITEGTVITRGDNAPAADEPVAIEKILGRVTGVLRDGRRVDSTSAFARAFASLRRRVRALIRG